MESLETPLMYIHGYFEKRVTGNVSFKSYNIIDDNN